jgi:hypothetical protein
MERQPSGPVGKDLVLEEQTSFVPDSYNLHPVIWVGKERGSMAPMERKVGENDAYSFPAFHFLDINVETLIPYKNKSPIVASCK